MGSACQPKLLASGFVAGPLAVGPDSIYVVDYGSGGRLLRVAKANGSITPIAAGSIFNVAVFGNQVYWTTSTSGSTDGRVTRAALDGSGAVDIATGQVTPAAIAVDASGVFWLSGIGAASSVMRLGPTDAAPFPFATAQPGASSLALDASNVYWMTTGTAADGSDGAVFAKAKSGGDVIPLALSQHDATGTGLSLTAAGGIVYFAPRGLGSTDGAVRSVPGIGGSIAEYAINQVRPQGIVADGSFVYWVDAGNGTDGLLQKASLSTRAVTQLAGNLANPGSLGIDGATLYFGSQGNSALAIPGGLYRLVP